MYREFVRVLHLYKRQEIDLKEVFVKMTGLFQHHTDLLLQFPSFLPDPNAVRVQPIAQVNDYTFFERAKRLLRNEHELYQEFLKCIILLNKQILSPAELLALAEDLFIDYPEIFKEFIDTIFYSYQ